LIQVVLPLLAKDGSLAGYVEGVSRVTAEMRQGQREQIWNTSATAVVSVLAAAVLLYPLMLAMLRRSGKLARRLLDANLSLMHSLGNAIAKRDSDTDAHNYRVTCYAVALAESLNIPDKSISELVVGAFLHDVGKIGIPDHILLKPGKLTPEEFKVMQTHALLGVEIVAGNSWLGAAAQTIRHHHERYDGKGYPDGLSGQEIPLTARIFAVVDVFDALTSVRPYKLALTLIDTIAIMERDAGKHFDPEIYTAFRELAPALYEKNRTWSHADWAAELKNVLARYFKTETAPEGAAFVTTQSVI
jgi:HD-GYP domain-containing protein (c-di-GMP phosphodiesterase class II)